MTAPALSPRRTLYAISALLAATLALSVALTVVALRPREVVVVPGVRESQVVLPEQVPDDAVKRFGLLYLRYFDSYLPQTIEEQSNHLLRFVARERLEEAQRALSERASYVLRAKEVSHLALPLPASCAVERIGRRFRFTAIAIRTTYIAGERKTVDRVTYTLDLAPDLPTEEDPYGLVVVGQSMKQEPIEDPDGKR
jgi:hypothetical protein